MWQERITIQPDVMGGKPCVRGTRIPVTMILDLIADDISFHQIIAEYYPQLVIEDIQACVEYARNVIEIEDIQLVSHTKIRIREG